MAEWGESEPQITTCVSIIWGPQGATPTPSGLSAFSQRGLLPSLRDTESLCERKAVGTQPKCTDLPPLPPTHLLPHHRVTHSLPSGACEGLLLLTWPDISPVPAWLRPPWG